MSIDEIRRQKADALLEFQESECRVIDAASTARSLAGRIEEFAKLLRPDDVPGKTGAAAVKGPNVAALRNEEFRTALDYEKAIEDKYKKGFDKYKNGFELTLHPDSLNDPLRWKKPRKIFVNSMSDLFHKDVSVEFIQQTFEVMNRASHHQFQVLTKRSARVLELSGQLPWAPNIWMGVSVESENYVHRIDNLRRTGAAVKFLSIEPLLGPLPRLNLDGIQQVIVGGESGTRARPMEEQWVQTILRDCREQQVAFFFKQWGGQDKKAAGRLLNGQTYSEMPGPRTHSMPEHLG